MGFKKIEINNGAQVSENLPIKYGFWSKFKAFWLQDVKFDLTPQENTFEDKLNSVFNTEITKKSVHDFLFQEISFGKKKNNKINVSVVEELELPNNNTNENDSDNIWGDIEK